MACAEQHVLPRRIRQFHPGQPQATSRQEKCGDASGAVCASSVGRLVFLNMPMLSHKERFHSSLR